MFLSAVFFIIEPGYRKKVYLDQSITLYLQKAKVKVVKQTLFRVKYLLSVQNVIR